MLSLVRRLRRMRPPWFLFLWTVLITAGTCTAVALGVPPERAVEPAIVLAVFGFAAAWTFPQPDPSYRLRRDREFKEVQQEFQTFRSAVVEKLNRNQVSHYSRKHELDDLRERLDALAERPIPQEPAVTRESTGEFERPAPLEHSDAVRPALGESLKQLTSRATGLKRTLTGYSLAFNTARLRRDPGAPLIPFQRELDLINASPLFDRDHYLAQTGDLPIDPVVHYVLVGSDLGYDPHPLFDSRHYRRRNLQAAVRHRSCLGHFLDPAVTSSDDPCPMFDTDWYNRQTGRAMKPREAVLHYLAEGDHLGLNPSPLFDTGWYRLHFGNIFTENTTALAHYLSAGRALGWIPNPAFDAEALTEVLGLPAEADVTAEVALRLHEAADAAPERPQHPTRGYWKWFNLATGRYREENTFALYRILGNDLLPQHQNGRTLANLRFILENEPAYIDCRKIWVLNRIMDADMKTRLIDLLEQHGAEYLDLPIDWAEYRRVGWNFRGLLNEYPSYGLDVDKRLEPEARHHYLEHLYHDKNLYLLNDNGARNFALRHGRSLAKWVLPWDGNCFITEHAWDRLRSYTTSNSHLRYVTVPVALLNEPNEMLLDSDFKVKATDEPQLVFRYDSEVEFNPDYRHGHRSKAELLHRLQIPGNWDRCAAYSWDPEPVVDAREANSWGTTSWVARLASGALQPEPAAETGSHDKYPGGGIRAFIDQADLNLIRNDFDSVRLFTLDEDLLELQVRTYRADTDPLLRDIGDHLVASARDHLNGPIYRLTDKTTTAPSKDPKDYWNPAPYWWPNPNTPDGLPYVARDGERAPGTVLGAPGSEKYDRTTLQRMIDETFVNALAHRFTGEGAFAEKAAAQIRAWFSEPGTRMNPHLRYSQVRLGHNNNVGNGRGILETKDFYYLLDAIRLVERSGRLTDADATALREWFVQFRHWLAASPQGRSGAAAPNNHATWYDVQVAAIDAFIDNPQGLQETFRRACERVGHQFAAEDGAQTEELKRTLTQHYCAYNYSGWLVLNDQGSRIGASLRDFEFPDGSGLREGLAWIGEHGGRPWQFEQIEPFDEDRFHAIGIWGHGAGLTDRPWGWLKPIEEVSPVFSVHYGIRPYWMIGNQSIRFGF